MNQENNTKIEITTGTIIRAILLILLLVFLYYIRDVLAILIFALVIASAIEPGASWFCRRHIPRVLSVLLVYLIAFFILGGAFYMIIPPLFSELSSFARQATLYLDQPLTYSSLPAFFSHIPVSLTAILNNVITGIQNYIAGFTKGFFQAATTIFGGVFSLILIVVISFYLAVQKNGIANFLRIITPLKYEDYVLDLWGRSREKIGQWLQGQILLGLLIGVFVFLGLSILQVPYALLLAILSAIFELIPIFGPVLAGTVAVIIALTQSLSLALMVLVFYVLVQQFENHLIYPIVMRKTTGVPPILVIIAMIIGGKLGGIFGMLLAVPLAAVLMEFMHDLAAKKKIV